MAELYCTYYAGRRAFGGWILNGLLFVRMNLLFMPYTPFAEAHTFLCILEGSDWLSSSITLICHWRQAVGYAIPQIMILLKHRIGLQPRILERQS